jgi:hypothetical protein
LLVNAGNDRRGPGRLTIRAADPALTPYAGLSIIGELARSTRLAELIDAELATAAGAALPGGAYPRDRTRADSRR